MRGAKGINPVKRMQNDLAYLVGIESANGWWVGSNKQMGISVLGQDPRKVLHRVLGGCDWLQVPAPKREYQHNNDNT